MFLEDKTVNPGVTYTPFSLESLIAWLETQDPEKRYDWHQCQGACLLSQYAYAIGEDGSHYNALIPKFKAAMGLSGLDGMYASFPISSYIAREAPWSYGAALARAKSFQPQR